MNNYNLKNKTSTVKELGTLLTTVEMCAKTQKNLNFNLHFGTNKQYTNKGSTNFSISHLSKRHVPSALFNPTALL